MAGGVVEQPVAQPQTPRKNYLNHVKTIGSWLVTLDHKRIAMMYLCAVSFARILGGGFALAWRTIRMDGSSRKKAPASWASPLRRSTTRCSRFTAR